MELTVARLQTLSLVLLAMGLGIAAALLVLREWGRLRQGRVIGRALRRAGAPSPVAFGAATDPDAPPAAANVLDLAAPPQELPAHWLQSRIGRMFVADEDRLLIDQCGFASVPAQLVFLVGRLALSALLPACGYALVRSGAIEQNTV
ncbi:MAG: type II secretion system F family protein, partial [Comamonadaceae bacterium]